jgi:hypothetical protein
MLIKAPRRAVGSGVIEGVKVSVGVAVGVVGMGVCVEEIAGVWVSAGGGLFVGWISTGLAGEQAARDTSKRRIMTHFCIK